MKNKIEIRGRGEENAGETGRAARGGGGGMILSFFNNSGVAERKEGKLRIIKSYRGVNKPIHCVIVPYLSVVATDFAGCACVGCVVIIGHFTNESINCGRQAGEAPGNILGKKSRTRN